MGALWIVTGEAIGYKYIYYKKHIVLVVYMSRNVNIEINRPDTWDSARLRDSLHRLKGSGIVSEEELYKINVRWGEPYNDKKWMAYCYPTVGHIVFTHRAYRMPDWVIDTIMWHEIAHVISKSDHSDQVFKEVNKRRRFQGIQEGISLILDKIGVYRL